MVNSKHLFFYLKITSATLQRCNAATLHHPRLSQSESSHLHKSMKRRNSAKYLEISDFLYNFAAEEQLKR